MYEKLSTVKNIISLFRAHNTQSKALPKKRRAKYRNDFFTALSALNADERKTYRKVFDKLYQVQRDLSSPTKKRQMQEAASKARAQAENQRRLNEARKAIYDMDNRRLIAPHPTSQKRPGKCHPHTKKNHRTRSVRWPLNSGEAQMIEVTHPT